MLRCFHRKMHSKFSRWCVTTSCFITAKKRWVCLNLHKNIWTVECSRWTSLLLNSSVLYSGLFLQCSHLVRAISMSYRTFYFGGYYGFLLKKRFTLISFLFLYWQSYIMMSKMFLSVLFFTSRCYFACVFISTVYSLCYLCRWKYFCDAIRSNNVN